MLCVHHVLPVHLVHQLYLVSMPKTSRYQALILRAMNVGEADRLCILFTREGGRKAARARGVRKPGSRLGGTLLPFRHVTVELSESEHHSTITGAVDRADVPDSAGAFDVFVRLQQGIEFLLALTEDDEPLPRVFDLLLQFVRLNGEPGVQALLPFQLRLLHLLGHMPESQEDQRYASLQEDSRAYIQACARIDDLKTLIDLYPDNTELPRFFRLLSGEQLVRPLKSMGL